MLHMQVLSLVFYKTCQEQQNEVICLYPVYWNLHGKRCIIFGAGHVAQRRVQALVEEQAQIVVYAPESMPTIWQDLPILYVQCIYCVDLLEENAWIFALTSDSSVNAQIVHDAKALGLPVCSATQGGEDVPDFQVPAVHHTTQFTAALSSGGSTPGLSAALCHTWGETLAQYDALCVCQASLRQVAKETIQDPQARHTYISQLSSPSLLSIYQMQGIDAYRAAAEQRLSSKYCAKTAVLMVMYGTSSADVYHASTVAMMDTVQDAFPMMDVFSACASDSMVKKLRDQGEHVGTIAETLTRLRDLGYARVYCQPTHLLNGASYAHVCVEIQKFKGAFDSLSVGRPLFCTMEDVSAFVQAIVPWLSVSQNTACILVGHGSTTSAGMVYPALQSWLQMHGYAHVYVGVMMGFPGIQDIVSALSASTYTHVCLLPMYWAAGSSVLQRLAGQDACTWKSKLEAQGYTVSVQHSGLSTLLAIREMYVSHLRQDMEQFNPQDAEI